MKIELTHDEMSVLRSVLECFIYQPVPLYKGSLDDIKTVETILFKKMKFPRYCLIRNEFIYEDE